MTPDDVALSGVANDLRVAIWNQHTIDSHLVSGPQRRKQIYIADVNGRLAKLGECYHYITEVHIAHFVLAAKPTHYIEDTIAKHLCEAALAE